MEFLVVYLVVLAGCIAYSFWFEDPQAPRSLRNFLLSIPMGFLHSLRVMFMLVVFFGVIAFFFGIGV